MSRGSTNNSNFLSSEYDDKDFLVANEIELWERDHSCNTEKITAMGNTKGGNWSMTTHGIQGRLIIEYYEQRCPNGENLPNCDICGGS